ncbi:helix-turn-helix domain-containing protein [Saccharopolyspora sp. K220]|uniref:helix-turn-helix domain-containing protein n=1 Tax=Saccharopolyspora soli TaxID=2926618 RepID=UPI001F5653C2|nr:helix-turn-helix transcriptional regulator [Saccharopolyspora soli]MCI2421711.1 helix-turn-helix domain-containing protein [Saccharopolyspora soli]
MTQGIDGGTSVVRRWQLAAALKALREQAGIRQEAAVDKLRRGPGRWSRSKLSRIENREHNVKPREVEQLLDAYGVDDPATRDDLVQLASASREQGWWASFNNELPDDVRQLLSIEGGLVALRDFQSQLVHGLLQTADYARAVMHAVYPGTFAPDDVERRVAARMVRQQIFAKDKPPRMHFILDQTILERVIGRPSIMRDQLRKLLDMTENPDVTIQVLPKEVPGSPGLEGPFALLTLPDPIPDIGYTEGPAGSLYIEDREQVRSRTLRFGILTELALSRADSIDAITKAMKDHQ